MLRLKPSWASPDLNVLRLDGMDDGGDLMHSSDS